MGELPGSQVSLVVFRASDGKLFNGTGFQTDRVSIESDLLANHRWGKSLFLPAGKYRVFARAFVPGTSMFQKTPAFADFEVR
jgi:hypothetical protein